MRIILIAFILLMNTLIIHAQYEFRPILDSIITCSYYNNTREFSENPLSDKQILEIFYIVEKMPSPKISISEIERILKDSIRFNLNELNSNEEIYFQCVVNCQGKAGDFQIIHCPSKLVNIGCQVLNVFRDKLNVWKPGELREKKVDTLIKIRLSINNGDFKVFAPSY
jgi:hypothetical protein